MVNRHKVKDSIDGTEGDDELWGVAFASPAIIKHGLIFNGFGGNDWLIGTNGGDVLNGGDGFDILDGRQGADELFGGADPDTFRFQNHASSSPTFGVDKVMDFEAQDFLDFSNLFNVVAITPENPYGLDPVDFDDFTLTTLGADHYQLSTELDFDGPVYPFVIEILGEMPTEANFILG